VLDDDQLEHKRTLLAAVVDLVGTRHRAYSVLQNRSVGSGGMELAFVLWISANRRLRFDRKELYERASRSYVGLGFRVHGRGEMG
jgi:microcompartment protein CcmK/EutM